MLLGDWLQRIENLHPVKWDPGLERVSAVGRRLDVLRPAKTVFLVGGTNGKGSTCAAIGAICSAQGHSVGVTTSPHLVRFNERIRVEGRTAGDDEICESFERIEAARGNISLTYFEFAALAAMDIFARRSVDVAVMEIGLGGRLDAMNIVDPDVSVITRIALDHEAWLGRDRDAIAREKAGIMRPQRPCIIADDHPPQTLGPCATEVGAVPLWLDVDFGRRGDQIYTRSGSDTHFFNYPKCEGAARVNEEACALPPQSLLAAIQATTSAGLAPSPTEVDFLFRKLRLAGRFQRIRGPRETVLDVAHNPDAAAWLAQRLSQVKTGKCRAVFGVYKDKDYAAVIDTLAPFIDGWYLCQVEDSRAASVQALEACVHRSGGSVAGRYAKISAAYDQAVKDSTAAEMILVFGSFPIVGGVLEHLGVPV